MRTYRKPKDDMLPRTIYCEHTHGRYHDDAMRSLERNLPFLNPDTGLRNRMLIRDPITGLGELPAEWNPLQEGHIERKSQPKRDPIRMEGELGQEYNCLYTTKELKCKPRDDRDPILLQGDLGKELDPFNPEGSSSARRRSERAIRRDPILGTGDFSTEPDPFRHSRYHKQTQERTDPITHTLPERGPSNRRTMRQFNERWISRDPIAHRYGNENGQQERGHEMRHYAQQKTGTDLVLGTSKSLPNSNGSARRPYVHRNPITGEGMRPEDYSDLLRVPSEYYFRQNPTVVHHASSPRPAISKSTAPTVATRPKPTRSTVSPPSRTLPRTSKSPMRAVDETTTNNEAPVVKKVIRPKRPTTVEQDYPAEQTLSNNRVEPTTVDRTNGRKLDSPRVSVREAGPRASEAKPMSFFEEAQLANGNTWDEANVTNGHSDSVSEPRESADYSESANSVQNGIPDEQLHEEPHSEEVDQENRYFTQIQSESPGELAKPYQSHTPNLDRAATGSLFEELQAHEHQHSIDNDVFEAEHNDNLQGTTAPLFVSTGEEECDEASGSGFPVANNEIVPETQHVVKQVEEHIVSDKEDDYISAFLKTPAKMAHSQNTDETVPTGDPESKNNPMIPQDMDDPQHTVHPED